MPKFNFLNLLFYREDSYIQAQSECANCTTKYFPSPRLEFFLPNASLEQIYPPEKISPSLGSKVLSVENYCFAFYSFFIQRYFFLEINFLKAINFPICLVSQNFFLNDELLEIIVYLFLILKIFIFRDQLYRI